MVIGVEIGQTHHHLPAISVIFGRFCQIAAIASVVNYLAIWLPPLCVLRSVRRPETVTYEAGSKGAESIGSRRGGDAASSRRYAD